MLHKPYVQKVPIPVGDDSRAHRYPPSTNAYLDQGHSQLLTSNAFVYEIEDANIDPEWTLLYYLRNKVGLNGTKLGCGEGGCGACTVLISNIVSKNGLDTLIHRAVNACLFPACGLHGLAVTTIEALGSLQTGLHPLQKRIADAHGSQCGFCTPGFVMAAYALFRSNPKPSTADLETAFQGNLCRCTGYRPILEAFSNLASDFAGSSPVSSHHITSCPMGSKCCRVRKTPEVLTERSASEGSIGARSSDEMTSDLGASLSVSSSCLSTSEEEESEDDKLKIDSPIERSRKYLPYDSSQDPIFPPELALTYKGLKNTYLHIRGKSATWMRPVTLEQLLQARHENPGAKIVMGNSELGVESRARRQPYPLLISALGVDDLGGIKFKEDGAVIGAATTLTDIQQQLKETETYLPEFQRRFFVAVIDMLHWFAGLQIRNVAGVGGNIITGSPISDLNPIFMAIGCDLQVASLSSGKRTIKMDERFFTGYRQNAVKPDEVLLSIKLPFSNQNEYLEAFKTSRRKEDDIAVVTLALYVRFEEDSDIVKNARVALGGMAPTTALGAKTARELIGKRLDSSALSAGQDALLQDFPLKPGAPGGMERYRSVLMLSLFLRAFTSIAEKICSKLSTDLIEASSRISVPHASFGQYFQQVSPSQVKTDLVGRPTVHQTAYLQASGEAVYCDDIPVRHNELFLAFVLSPKAHARIISIDGKDALAIPGVRGIVTAADVPHPHRHEAPSYMHEEVFAIDTVYYNGQIVAGVVADNAATARRAARAVKVQYEDLKPVILTIEEAIENESYLCEEAGYVIGTPMETLKEAKAEGRMVSGEVRTAGQEHFYMEPQSSLVLPTEDGGVEIISATQHPSGIQMEASRILGIPGHRIVCKVKRLGGGFGGKETKAALIALPAAVAAVKYRHPVRCVLERDDDMVITAQRHPTLARYKIAADSNNRIVAMDLEVYTNTGYSADLAIPMMERVIHNATNAYRIPNLRIRGKICRTNLPSNTAFRGFGCPQGQFIAESALRKLAYHLGKDPVEFAEENLLEKGDVMPYNCIIESNMMRRIWSECLQQAEYAERKKSVEEFNRCNRFRKRGLSVVPTVFAVGFTAKFMNQAAALLLAYEDGSVLLTHGGTEMGQGLHTKMIQVASRSLGIPASKVFIAETATDKIPNAQPTAGSVSSDMNGMAVKEACDKLIERLAPYKKANPKGTWEEWVNAAYMDRVKLSVTGFFRNPVEGYDLKTNTGIPYNYITYGVACSEVEVDTLTGEHQVMSTGIVMDVGNSLNPALDIGQIEGGFAQGYGLFVLEEPVVSPDGMLRSRGPGAYKIPAMADMPRKFRVSLATDSSNPFAIFSSKAIGEPPLFLAASTFFAIQESIRAARIERGRNPDFQLDAPATVERIRLACEDVITDKVPFNDSEPHTPWAIRP